MRLAAIIASALALLLSVAWLAYKPGFDSGVAVAVALAALLSSFFLKRAKPKEGQNQQVSGSSIGIQAGRDANVHNIKNK
jgi:membrane protein implicated in regulation of membrane protease activity